MLARERIEYLLDDGSFHELDMLAAIEHTMLDWTNAPTQTELSLAGGQSTVAKFL